MKSRILRTVAAAVVPLLLLASCGSDTDDGQPQGSTAQGSSSGVDSSAADTTAQSLAENGSGSAVQTSGAGTASGGAGATGDSGAAPGISTVAGCESLVIDTAVGSESPVCSAGAPAAQPLAEKTSLKVSFGDASVETNGLYMMAIEKGEFVAENLDISTVTLPFTDALPMIASGELDLACSGPHSSYFNAIEQGFDVKWVLNKYYEPEGEYGGLWGRPGMTLEKLKGGTIGSALGATTSSMARLKQMLEGAGLSLKDVTITQVPSTDMSLALQNGVIDAGVLTTPAWLTLMKEDGSTEFEFLGSVVPVGSSLYGCVAGPSLLEANRPAGVALMRAIARTQFTYFRPGWKDNADFVAELATVMDSKPEALAKTPEPIFDWLIRDGTTDLLQQAFIELGVLKYDQPIPEDKVVDQSLMYEALGVAAG